MTRSLVSLLLALSLLAGCANLQNIKVTENKDGELNAPDTPVPDAELLDVGVVILDPGISSVEDEEQIYPAIRRAEATYMATKLADVLNEQGGWGAVRVVPDERQFSDLLVRGKILQSDGETLELKIRVFDARGTMWLDKRYTGITGPKGYYKKEPFLSVYRMIANDMLAAFQRLPAEERTTIRQVAEMRFARDFANGAFADYLNEDPSGQVTLLRLPSEADPMLARVRGLRQRHYVFVDTLQGHYTGFSDDMYASYQDWRKESFKQTVALEELTSEAQTDIWVGAAEILGGVAAQTSGDRVTRSAGAIGVVDGARRLKSGLQKRAESNIHSSTLEELGQSLDAEITPRVIELEDRTVRLSGNVEDQYDQWRELLADIYAAELAALEPPQPEPRSPTLLHDTQGP